MSKATSYAQKTLLQNEKILFYSRPHGAIFFVSFLWLLCSIFLLGFHPKVFSGFVFFKIPINVIFGFAVLIIALFQSFLVFISYISSEYVVTNKRVLMKVGLIQRHSLEIFVSKIESIYIDQSITGRIFNFGTIVICGIGSSKDVFNYIPDPLRFRQLIQGQTEKE